jgi:hypothetical protein
MSMQHLVRRRARRSVGALAALLGAATVFAAADAAAQGTSAADPRVGLRAGLADAGVAARGMELVANTPRPAGFSDPRSPGNILFANTDIAFQGNLLFLGNFAGFQIYDIADPSQPRLRTAVVCPGGQGDVSVYGNLLFMSVEMPNGRVDCGTEAPMQRVSPERFLGVRIFDISDVDRPKQVAAVQTCRGSHTHTLVTDPKDAAHVYVYVSGASMVRPAEELAGCSGRPPNEDPNTAYFRIEVIRVPLAAPQEARVVNAPRIYADDSGNIGGLWRGGDHGPGTQTTAATDHCHDITAYPELGLAAGACSGNGILLDISDPANPVRIAEVTDPNFAYWHSATFNNDGSKVIFTDEWGGGMQARCRASDRAEWGANALFRLNDRALEHAGYYKLPVPQTETENCVAHNGSLVPVPGRDIKVQAWYQGGISVLDFTDPANAFEIAYFDRGPLSPTQLMLGGFWSAYWYNGHVYGSEISRGLDVLRLTPGEHLTQNEIDAAQLVRLEEFNAQTQARLVWPASFVVARAYLDQLERAGGAQATQAKQVAAELERAERLQGAEQRTALTQVAGTVAQLEAQARAAGAARRSDADRLQALARVLSELGDRAR